jgi:sec-independent protein translocase protein TatA
LVKRWRARFISDFTLLPPERKVDRNERSKDFGLKRYDEPMVPSVGPLEIAIVLVIALVVFGPRRIPEMGRSLGSGLRGFRHALEGDQGEKGGESELPLPSESDQRIQ